MYQDEIERVTEHQIAEFIDKWDRDKKNSPCVLLLAKIHKGLYVAVDNTTQDCWTEEFKKKKKAIKWLKRV